MNYESVKFQSIKKSFCQAKSEDAALECLIRETGTGRRANCALTLCTLLHLPTLLLDKLGTL